MRLGSDPMTNLQRFAIIPILAVILLPLLKPNVVSAQSSGVTQYFMEGCDIGGTNLGEWDWPKAIRERLSSGGGSPTTNPLIDEFDHANDSYVIVKTPDNTRNVYDLYYAGEGKQITIEKDTTNGKITSNGSGVIQIRIVSESEGTYGNTSDNYTIASVSTPYPFDYINASYNPCMVGAHNVKYGAAWLASDLAEFRNDIPFGTSDPASCGKLDIACWIGKSFNKVTDAMTRFGMAILEGLSKLFIPDSSMIKTEFDNFTSFMNDKLGILTYPATFFVNFFTAFGNTSNNWCNTTTCAKSFGNFFGSNMSIDFHQFQTTMPTLWTWLIGLARGMLVLSLIYALRRKYLEVIAK